MKNIGKNIYGIITAIALCVSSVTLIGAEEAEDDNISYYIRGDIDGNSKINVFDFIMLKEVVITVQKDEVPEMADMNFDKSVNLLDIAFMKKYLLSEEKELDITPPEISVAYPVSGFYEGSSHIVTAKAEDDNEIYSINIVEGDKSTGVTDGKYSIMQESAGTYVFFAEAYDSSGNKAVRECKYEVKAPIADDEIPEIQIGVSNENIVMMNTQAKVSAFFSDTEIKIPLNEIIIKIDGKQVEIGEDGYAVFESDTLGKHTAEAIFGARTAASVDFRVIDNDNSKTAVIKYPLKDETLSGNIPIIGTVSLQGLMFYNLEYCKKGTDKYISFSGQISNYQLNTVLSELDTTTLENGEYTIRLSAYSLWSNSVSEVEIAVNN